MLTSIAHRIVSNPLVYDAVQIALGAQAVDRRLVAQIAHLPTPTIVLDMGGGTGIHRKLFPESSTYVCLDMDPLKLSRFRELHPSGAALVGDATCSPFPDESLEVVLCTFVAHHLPDELLGGFFREIHRILSPRGSFIFMDPIWSPKRLASRVLWRFDVGQHPRTQETLGGELAKWFDIVHAERFSVFHEYFLVRAKRRMI